MTTERSIVEMLAPFECWPKISIDYDAIAQGIYDMTHDLPDDSYVAALGFGMLPAPLMEVLEKQLVDKVLGENCKLFSMECTDKNKALFVLPKGKINEVVHQVSLGVYKLAKESGLMIV